MENNKTNPEKVLSKVSAYRYCSEAVFNALQREEIEAKDALNYYKWAMSNPNQSVADKEFAESCYETIKCLLKPKSEQLIRLLDQIDSKHLKNRQQTYLVKPENFPKRLPIRKPASYPKENVFKPKVKIKLDEDTKAALRSINSFIELAVTKRLTPQEIALVVQTQIKLLYKNQSSR